MDWQHLLMNGEHLPEYAALLAAEGLLGHQHANSGWGIFDDDNMVGATAFMETVELALELRRADYGANGERLGFDLYPYTEDQVAAVRAVGRAVALHRRGRRSASTTPPCARRSSARTPSPPTSSSTPRWGAPTRVMTRLLGLDVGTSSVKGIAIDDDGAVLGRRRARLPAVDAASRLERAGPRGLVARRGRGARRARRRPAPRGIGLSGQMHGLVALDDGGRPLRPAILWNDGRTQAQCDEIEERIGFERLVELTGNRALAGFTAPKLLWLAEHEPEVYGRIAHILLPKDYVRLQAHRRARDRRRRRLGHAALRRRRARAGATRCVEALDVDPAWLPQVSESPGVDRRDPRRRAGRRRRGRPGRGRAGRRRGGRGRPGVGRARARAASCFAALDRYAHDPEARVHAFCHAVPQAWHIMGVMLSAAGSLQWLRETVGGGPTTSCSAARRDWEPGVEGLLFAPYLAGERTPHADPDARGAFAGLGLRHDRGALARAVLEGVAFGLRDALDLVEELGGRPRVGRISGGGARSQLWLEIVASVLEMPLEATVVDEGAAYGAALLGGVAAGVWERRARGGVGVREGHAHDRAAAGVDRALRRAPASVPRVYPALRAVRGD